MWRLGELESAELPVEQGRHLKLWGRGPKLTGSLVPLQQMALLTTYLETLFFWSPLIPVLSLAILGAALVTGTGNVTECHRILCFAQRLEYQGFAYFFCFRQEINFLKCRPPFFLATQANLLLFDMGVWSFNVRVPSDAMNQSAALSRWQKHSDVILGKGFLPAWQVVFEDGPWSQLLLSAAQHN